MKFTFAVTRAAKNAADSMDFRLDVAVVAGRFPLLFVFFRVLFGDTTPPFHREIRRRRCGHAARDGSTRENEIEVASSAHEEMRDSFTLPIHFFL